MSEVLVQFKKHARRCSCHYADDTGKEWGAARQEKAKALELFDAHPELQAQMREAMKEELWAAEFKEARP